MRYGPLRPGEQPKDRKFIKLNTNENPYPPSPKVLEAIRAAAGDALRLYPDPECTPFRAAIAEFYGLTPDMVFPGNGSDEILAFCFQAFFDPDRAILFSDITYSFYPVYANYFGLTYQQVSLGENLEMPVAELCRGGAGGVVLANPNAPTGRALEREDIRGILEANRDCVVLVDEAYVDFGAQSAVELIPAYDNLVVIHTLSKSRALAGLRVGYALGQPHLMAALCCVRDSINSYTVDRVAQAGATAAIEDRVYLEEITQRVMATRARSQVRLQELGFQFPPSQSNFLFITHPEKPARELLSGLREKGILVRWFDQPRMDHYLRVSIGTDEEMDALCTALQELLG